MTLKDKLTPKDTEEVKPGIFIQKKNDKYRVINPIAFNGAWRLKHQFSLRNLVWIVVLLFLVWSYNQDNKELINFYNRVTSNPILYCQQVMSVGQVECTDYWEKAGLCSKSVGIDLTNIKNKTDEWDRPNI